MIQQLVARDLGVRRVLTQGADERRRQSDHGWRPLSTDGEISARSYRPMMRSVPFPRSPRDGKIGRASCRGSVEVREMALGTKRKEGLADGWTDLCGRATTDG